MEPTHIAVFGRQPELGIAELEALLGSEHVSPFGRQHALLTCTDAPKHAGSTVKFARLLAELDTTDWPVIEKYLVESVSEHESYVPEGKLTIGLSVFGLQVSTRQLGHTSLLVKKAIKKTGRPVRLVPNTHIAMNSAQVLHNKLTGERGWELCLFRVGQKTLLAQTVWEQPIEEYAKRDQARPMRDARVGMLPPKLAQTIVNLAVGSPLQSDHPPVVLDPFCGTGVVIQEGLLMGYHMIGSDLEPRMIDFTQKNIEWLHDRIGYDGLLRHLDVGDATSHQWIDGKDITNVACETFLGKPFSGNVTSAEIDKEKHAVGGIIKKTLRNLSTQLPSGARLCLAIPAWHINGKTITLPLIDQLADLGYNLVSFRHVRSDSLVYHRDGQVVGRQLLVIYKD